MKKIMIGIIVVVLIVSTLLIVNGIKTEKVGLGEVEENHIEREIGMKIIKARRIQDGFMDGLEVEFIVDGETKMEGFDDYNYWMEEIDGEKRFITRMKENYANAKKSANSTEKSDKIITEINEFKDMEVK